MKYYKYLHYVIRHKWFVMIECFKKGLYWRGVMHDMSKFRPSEFFPYANYFYGEYKSIDDVHGDMRNAMTVYKEDIELAFDFSWLCHQRRNKHHWQYWVLIEDSGKEKVFLMPEKYRSEMICDWVGAVKALGFNSPEDDKYKETREWYSKNKDNMKLHPYTRLKIELEIKYISYKEKT